jgi:hypothetical protein
MGLSITPLYSLKTVLQDGTQNKGILEESWGSRSHHCIHSQLCYKLEPNIREILREVGGLDYTTVSTHNSVISWNTI